MNPGAEVIAIASECECHSAIMGRLVCVSVAVRETRHGVPFIIVRNGMCRDIDTTAGEQSLLRVRQSVSQRAEEDTGVVRRSEINFDIASRSRTTDQ